MQDDAMEAVLDGEAAASILMSAEELEAEDVPAVDAKVRVRVAQDWMTAEAEVSPPEGKGEHITYEALTQALAREKVVSGLDEDVLRALAAPSYDTTLVVARGTPAQDGADGVCKELYDRTREKQFAERKDGSVDFKELGLILDITTGTVICELTPPTAAVDGTDVRGQPVKGRDGVKAVAPAGENTRMSADETRLEAAATGNLVFRNGRFCVETVVRFENIDYESGNITFSGDVLVNGDVQDGFVIKAGGSVTLRGRVGNVQVTAGGDIVLEKGINGADKALLETEKTLKAGFMENCRVRIGEKIIADSIINSQVECEGDVEATGKKGVIVGGKLTVFGSVTAKTIGNESNTLTVISLGVTPRLLKERARITEQMEDVNAHIDELTKNVTYIEKLVKDGRPVPPERLQMLKRSQISLPITEKKRDQLKQELAELEARMQQVNQSTLTANVIYPPTKVSIGATSTNVIEMHQRCRVYKKDGELVFGSA